MAFALSKVSDIPYFNSRKSTEDFVAAMGGKKYLEKLDNSMKKLQERYRPRKTKV